MCTPELYYIRSIDFETNPVLIRQDQACYFGMAKLNCSAPFAPFIVTYRTYLTSTRLTYKLHRYNRIGFYWIHSVYQYPAVFGRNRQKCPIRTRTRDVFETA